MRTLTVLAGGLALTAAASAQVVVNFDIYLTGNGSLPSTAPASLTVTDQGDDLQLTFAASGLSGSAYIDTLWLNLPAGAGLSLVAGSKVGTFELPSLSGADNHNGIGERYSFGTDALRNEIGWKASFANAAAKRFGAGEAISFLVDHPTAALDPLDLLNFSEGNMGPLIGAIHINSTANGDSLKYGLTAGPTTFQYQVPEPRTYALLFGLGVLGFALVRRRLGRVQ